MAPKILVVDDEPQFERLILQRFRRKIKDGVYNFVFACDGLEALDIIDRESALDLVLADINMPKMDGLTLLGKIKAIDPLLKTVIVSAYGDMQNIRTAMNRGAFDFVTKPIDFPDLEATIDKALQEAELVKKIKMAEELEEKNNKLREIDRIKSRFFTDISHEFRTPLTVISGMAGQIEANPDRWLEKGIPMIRRNSRNLLDLVNQILDLRKLESGKMTLNPVQTDMMNYLAYISESFQSLAEAKDIKLYFLQKEKKLVMDYDPEKLLRVLSNLLSNAIKFTPEGGQVYIQVSRSGDFLQIQVKDTGVGIPAEILPRIFDRYFQAENFSGQNIGSGIGLSLVNELVNLMQGELKVDSQEGRGTVFTLLLPITRKAPPAPAGDFTPEFFEQTKNSAAPSLSSSLQLKMEAVQEGITELPSLMIIEDNPDVAQYLVSCLEGRYRLEVAEDGSQGIDKALEQIPDIIISDVMMPHKDGFEVCEILKNDERTSHIPIILLTAKVDAESRIAGLKRGADAYLAKPFNKQELLVRLEKLLELREKLRERYRSLEKLPAGEGTLSPEDQFIKKAQDAVEENIDDEEFGIHQLCRAVGMSRTQLHRKMKALTGRPTSHFIRLIRLNKAKKLLNSTDLNISQVAYEVGFKDPKYFSRTFSEEFGQPPSEMRK